ncbi:MAG: formylglycine-generating enzyme family protein, partial [Planctomycetaceae bacterium]
MAEFFAGLYLGRYCDQRVIKELQPEIGRGEWNNVWRFVAELPETMNSSGQPACEPDSLCFSLQALFAVPDTGKVRPTESMFRAWQVLQRNEWLSNVRQQVLGGWRQQFRRILIEGYEQGQPTARARTAAEVVFEEDLERFVKAGKEFEQDRINQRLRELDKIKRPTVREKSELETLSASYETLEKLNTSEWCRKLQPKFSVYALCSNAKTGDPDNLTFMMGASKKDKDANAHEKPWQKVSVPAFYMATACVTKSQYALFDPQRGKARSDFNEKSPDPDCPMIYVNFHDGICFALWLDDRYSLPSEVQWEGAAWGG